MMKDRIRLAEAMGWRDCMTHNDGSISGIPYPKKDAGKLEYPRFDLPNPFECANDDYAVLEWFRSGKSIGKYEYPDWGAHFSSGSYQIGDYARAALEVIQPPSIDGRESS